MKKIIYFSLFFLKCVSVFSQNLDLAIDENNIRIEENAVDGGFDMWIKAPDDVKSVLITESTADPEKKNAVYSFRAEEYNTINGGERRILDGKLMDQNKNNYFLIDSTREEHEEWGEAFRIFIPQIIQYGYLWTPRKGEICISNETFLNIRSFEKPYADYSGAFYDNPFTMAMEGTTSAAASIGGTTSTAASIGGTTSTAASIGGTTSTAASIGGIISTAASTSNTAQEKEAPPIEARGSFSVNRKYSLYGLNNGKTNRNTSTSTSTWKRRETIIFSP